MVREDDWRPLLREVNGRTEATGRQWAEVCFVPNKIGHSKKGPQYRYLATREDGMVQCDYRSYRCSFWSLAVKNRQVKQRNSGTGSEAIGATH